jgi:hypothetical protein
MHHSVSAARSQPSPASLAEPHFDAERHPEVVGSCPPVFASLRDPKARPRQGDAAVRSQPDRELRQRHDRERSPQRDRRPQLTVAPPLGDPRSCDPHAAELDSGAEGDFDDANRRDPATPRRPGGERHVRATATSIRVASVGDRPIAASQLHPPVAAEGEGSGRTQARADRRLQPVGDTARSPKREPAIEARTLRRLQHLRLLQRLRPALVRLLSLPLRWRRDASTEGARIIRRSHAEHRRVVP